jgi:hypothetical protein
MITLEDVLAAARCVAAEARRGAEPEAAARALRALNAAEGGPLGSTARRASGAPPRPPFGEREFLRAAAAVCQVWSAPDAGPVDAAPGRGAADAVVSKV